MSLTHTVILSAQSQELLNRYAVLVQKPCLSLTVNSIALSTLIEWLNLKNDECATALNKNQQQKLEFAQAALHTSLLHDILATIAPHTANSLFQEQQKQSTAKKVKLAVLAVAGLFFAACEGFDGITTTLGVFASPSLWTLCAGLIFSLLSIVVFYVYNLTQLSNNLGVQLTDAPKLLDLYVQQMQHMKLLRKQINRMNLVTLTHDDSVHLASIVLLLQRELKELGAKSQQFARALKSKKMQVIKYIFTGVAGAIFFCGGFCAGQSVSVFLLSLLITNLAIPLWPVVVFSVLVGLAALSLYWYVERPEIDQLVSAWFGLDQHKIAKLCDPDKLQREADELDNLKVKIEDAALVAKQLETLRMDTKQGEIISVKEEVVGKQEEPPRMSMNIYAFLRPQLDSKAEDILDEGYRNSAMGL